MRPGKVNEPVKFIRAQVIETTPEIQEFKPYRTTLGFEGKLYVEVPVPASEVTEEGGSFILTMDGWKAFLKAYTEKIEELKIEKQQSVQRYQP